MRTFIIIVLCLLMVKTYSVGQQDLEKLSIAELDTLYVKLNEERQYEKLLEVVAISTQKTLEKYGEADSLYVNKLWDLTNAYGSLRQIPKYEENLLKTIALEEKYRGKNRGLYIKFHLRLAGLYRNTKRIALAEKIYIELKPIISSKVGKQHSLYISLLNSLGAIAQRKKQYKLAEKHYTEATLLVNNKKISNLDLLEPFDNLAVLYYQTGQYTKAEKLYKENINARNEARDSVPKNKLRALENKNTNTHNNLAALYYVTGRYAEAEQLYLEVIQRKKKYIDRHPTSYSNSLNNLASLYSNMGRYDEAESLSLEALKIRKTKLGITDPKYAQSLNNLSILYNKMNRSNDAKKYCLNTLAIYKETIGEKTAKYAIALSNLANIYMKHGQYTKAQELHNEALQIQKQVVGDQHKNYAVALSHLGDVSLKTNNLSDAEQFQLKALEVYKTIFPRFHPTRLKTLNTLAQIYINQDLFEKAQGYLNQAIASNIHKDSIVNLIDENWSKNIATVEHSSQVELDRSLELSYQLLALQSKSNNQEKQLILCKLALQLLDQTRNEYNSKEDKLRTLAQSNSWTTKALETIYSLDKEDKSLQAEAFRLSEANKSVLLKEAAQTRQAHIFGELPDTLAEKEQYLQKLLAKNKVALLQAKYASKDPTKLHAKRSQLNQELDSLNKYIEKHYPKYSNYKQGKNSVSLQEIQKSLDDKTAIIEYVLSDSGIYCFYIDNASSSFNQTIISIKDLNKKIRDLRQNFTNTQRIIDKPQEVYEEFAELAHWFYQKLLAPILSKSAPQQIKHLIFVTDRGLGHLPFESFLVEPAASKEMDFGSLHYLIQDYQVSYDYSASLWKENNSQAQQINGKMLAIAGNYNQQITDEVSRLRLPYDQVMRRTLGPLKGAKKEVNNLLKIYEGEFITDSLSGEQFFKKNANQYGIIHLAMHGILNQKNPLLSSLAFSENGDSTENNFLQAHEISHQQLNAALVVLSACETGYGKFEKGNGIASLARAFMYAGVPSLVVSLWQVNDQSTAIVMETFYKYLTAGSNKAIALQKAKKDYLQNIGNPLAKHPAFWSPFILLGNSQAIEVDKKGQSGWLWIGAAALGLAFLGFLGVKKMKSS
ncbi:MAG: CHAT domain-containing protein [Aureispira sp.]|nr:CHAT domain-containing protein [Aureispira sp.]